MSPVDPQARIKALERKIAQLQSALVTDELTGILNRRGLMEMLVIMYKEVSYQLQHPQKRRNVIIKSLSVIFIDIDHFKNVNTRYGHAGGDAALERVAQTIKARLRGIDVVGRYGGEEIVVGLIGADGSSAAQIAEDLRATIANLSVQTKTGKISITISCGVASLRSKDSLEQLIKRADKAVYEAKNSGRNKVVTL